MIEAGHYPDESDEMEILELTTSGYRPNLTPVMDRESLISAIAAVRRVEVEDSLIHYATRLVRLSRPAFPEAPDFIRELLAWGGGPRTVQSLIAGARAHALLNGRSAATLEDFQRIAAPTLRHRFILSYHAEAEGVEPDSVVARLLSTMSGDKGADETRGRSGFLSRFLARVSDRRS